MSRHDHNLAAHVANCRSEQCDYCEGLAEERARPMLPSDWDLGWAASRAEDRERRWVR